MNTKMLSTLSLFCCAFLLPASAQQLPENARMLLDQLPGKTIPQDLALLLPECTPDSVLSYTYLTPSDSILEERIIHQKYGEDAIAVYTYQLDQPLLLSTDSSVYDALGRTIFNEQWEYDDLLEELVFSERTFYYPHGNSAVLHDSIIVYDLSFVSGTIEPDTKTIFTFGPNDRVEEEEEFYYDGSSFVTDRKAVYYYDGDKIDHVEVYTWTGSDYELEFDSEYTYDSNDSLSTIIQTEVASGLPNSKTEYTYDPAEGTTRIELSGWDENAGDWELLLYALIDLDESGRVEATETGFIFFGLGFRYEYTYLASSPCIWFSQIFFSSDFQNWEFAGTSYYFPNTPPSSASAVADLPWTLSPNPAADRFWVTLPEGDQTFTHFQLVNMLGQTALQGVCNYPVTEIGLQGIKAGAYTLVLQGKKGVVSRKVIVR